MLGERRRCRETSVVRDESEPIAKPAASPPESFSQFLARVLDQLSRSAWLPSAALVLLLVLAISVANAIRTAGVDESVPESIGNAFEGLAQMSFGGVTLLVLAIVVTTVVTQAFVFESIRVLEGYWGTRSIPRRLAKRRCNRHAKVRTRLLLEKEAATERAWATAVPRLEATQDQDQKARRAVRITPSMISVLKAAVLHKKPPVQLSPDEERRLKGVDWKRYADPALLLERLSLEKRLRDYPRSDRLLPTRLGNVLRAYEDKTKVSSIESFIQRNLERLSPSLAEEHDDQRIRLDLYCSMVFVMAFVTIAGSTALAFADWRVALCWFAAGSLGTWLMYLGALASARAYGGILVIAADYLRSFDAARRD